VKSFVASIAAALCLFLALPAHADVLIDNVAGLTADEEGRITTFHAILIGDDGRIEQVFAKRDKKPGKVDYRLDGKGRVMIPGLIDSHVHVMELGFALLKAEAGFKGSPMGEPRAEDRDLAFSKAQDLLLSAGVTTVADMGMTIEDWQTYRRAGDLGSLRLRIVTYAQSVGDMALISGPRPTPWLYDDRLKHNGLALVLDGLLETRGAWLKAPYGQGSHGQNSDSSAGNRQKPAVEAGARMTTIQLRNLMSRGAIDNFQVAVTAHGDAATSATLDAIEELAQTYDGDRRWRLEALTLLDSADLARMVELNIIASVQPQRLDLHRPMADTLLGTQRAHRLHRWRPLADKGVTLAFGSGANAKRPKPFAAMATAISRQSGNDLSFGSPQTQEHLTRQQALAAFTNGAAHALFGDGRLGRLAKGHRADFLLIDRDPLLASPADLRETGVLQSWINGVLVYEAPGSPFSER